MNLVQRPAQSLLELPTRRTREEGSPTCRLR